MYKSTRGNEITTSSLAIIKGIANDGGLYVKDIDKRYNIDELKKLSKLNYKELAIEIMSLFLEDFSKEEIYNIVNKSYNNTFDINEIVNLKSVNDKLTFLELFHGKTLAFKDIALQVLPNLLSKSKEKNNIKKNNIILTATSGDTGSSALAGFVNSENDKVIVLYPNNGVSEIQEKQMHSFKSHNRRVVAVEGNFDECQTLVKKIFQNENAKTWGLTSANSINIGRLIPQIVYYFYGYFKIAKDFELIDVCVPTGNFGDILAGYIARSLGLPINKLICASNSNNVLDDFIRSGEYNINRNFFKTISPSMDILISSNLERLLYYKLKDSEKVKSLMDDLKNNKLYKVNLELNEFASETCSEKETYEAIYEVYNLYNYIIDPHTAVAYECFKKYTLESKTNNKTLILSTAHPMKFSKTVCKALGKDFSCENEAIDYLYQLGLNKPSQIEKLKEVKNKEIINKENAYEEIINIIRSLYND